MSSAERDPGPVVPRSGGVPDPAAPAERIGPFLIRRLLGRGGQGAVYLAEDGRDGKTVALKVLDGLAGGAVEAIARFRREASITTRLRHPGICPVYDADVHGRVPWIAMPFVEGQTLDRALSDPATAAGPARGRDGRSPATKPEPASVPSEGPKSRPLPPGPEALRRLVSLVAGVARTLHAAHEAGVVHRDLKPGNIMITPAGDPVILDFGLARLDDDDLPSLTRTGDLLGTPAYMSPEQLTRKSLRIDRRTDIWSLGVILYECLTSRRPFETPTREGLYQAILTREPEDPRRLNRGISRTLKAVIETALQKDRDRRYQTAAAFAQDLEAVLRGLPVAARPMGPISRAWRWSRREPAKAALFLTLLLGLGASLVLASSLADQRDAARRAESRAKSEAEINEGVNRFMSEVFKRGDANTSTGRADMTVREALDGASHALLEGKSTYRPEVESAIRMIVAESYLSIGRIDAAAQHLVRAMDLRRAVYGTESPEFAAVAQNLGRAFRLQDRFADAERWLREAVRIRRVVLEGSPWLAQSLNSLAIFLRHQGRPAEAEPVFAEALEIYRKTLGEDNENVSAVLNAIALLQSRQGRWAEAEVNARRSLEVITRCFEGRPHLDVAHAISNLGTILYSAGRKEEGERLLREGLEMVESLVGSQHRTYADLALTFAHLLRQGGRNSEAGVLLAEGIAAYEALDQPETADTHRLELANVYLDTGRAPEVEPLVAALLERTRQPKTRRGTLRSRGVARARLKRFAEAELDLKEAWTLAGDEPSDRPDRQSIAAALVDLYSAWSADDPDPSRASQLLEWQKLRVSLAAEAPPH